MRYYSLFIQKYHHYLLFGLILTFCSCLGQMFFISLFGGDFRQHLELSHSALGQIFSITTLMSGLLLFFLGAKFDFHKISNLTLITLFTLIAAMFLMGQVKNPIAFFISLFVIRFCSQSMLGHIAMASIAKVFLLHRGKAIGVISIGFSLGEAILPLCAVTLMSYYTWQEVWIILSCMLLCVVSPMLFFLTKKIKVKMSNQGQDFFSDDFLNVKENELKKEIPSLNRSQVLKDKKFYLLLPTLLAPTFIITGIFFSYIPLMIEEHSEPGLLASCFVVFSLSNLFGSLYFGKKIDEKGCINMMNVILPLLALGVFSLRFVSSPVLSVGFYMFCVGMAVGGNRIILNTIWVELYGIKFLSEIRVMVVLICIIAAGVSPILFGHLLDQGLSMNSILAYCCFYIMISMLILKSVKTVP